MCRDALSYGDDLFHSELHMGFALPGMENDGHQNVNNLQVGTGVSLQRDEVCE